MAAKESQEPLSRPVSPQRAAETKGRSPDEQTAGDRLRVDVPAAQAAEQWQRTFDAVSDLIAILDTQHRIVRINQAMADRLGLAKEQCAGQTCYGLVHGTDEPPPFCPHARLLQDGEEHTLDVRVERLAGDFFVTASPLRDPTGCLVGSVHVAHDITERKRAEKRLQIQHKLALALAAAGSLGDAIPLCLDAAIRASGMDAGGLYLVDRTTGSLELACSQGLSSEFVALVSHYDADSPNASLVAKGQPAYTLYHQLGVPLSATKRAEGLRAIAVVPVFHEGSAIACLNVASHTLDEMSAGTRRVVEGVAAQIGGAIARLQGEDALRESEERFRTLFEDAPDPIYLNDLNGEFIDGNRAAEEITGYKKEELVGKNLLTAGLLIPADIPKASERISRNVAGQPTGPDEFTLKRKDGSLATLEIRTFPLKIHAETMVLGIARDITERRRAEQALHESEQRFRDLAELLPQTVYEMDLEGRLTFVNRQALHTFGYTRADFEAGVSCFDVLAPEELDRARQNVRRVLQGQDFGGLEYTAQRKDGTQFPVAIYSSPILRGDTPVGVRGIIIDVTESKQADEALRDSERRYRTLVETAQEGIGITDSDESIVFANQALADLLGYTKDELVGLNLSEITDEKEFAKYRAQTQRRLKGEHSRYETMLRTKSGQRRWFSLSAAPLHTDDKTFLGTMGLLTDITERKQAERELRESEARFAELFANMSSGVAVYEAVEDGRDFVFKDFNKAGERIECTTKEEVIGRRVTEAFPGVKEFGLLAVFQQVWRTGTPQQHPVSIYKDERIAGWRENYVYRLPSGEVIAVYDDVTERKRAEKAIRRAEKMQAEAEKLAATGRMAAQIAHEINNPLAGIKNCFRLIRDAVPEDHPDRDMVGLIDREIDRVTHVVQQMYKLHSPQAERPTDILVEETIRDVLVMLEPLGRAHEVAIELATVSPKLMVRAPEGSLQQVLYNLTVNAIQASPQSGIVNILAEPVDKDFVRISIRDRGPGIPAEVQDRMFEPFFSADTGNRAKEGIGLGLSIVKSIVESLEGKIEVESRVGEGACFHVYLPSKQP